MSARNRWVCSLGALIAATGCTAAGDGNPAAVRSALAGLELTRSPAVWSPPEEGADGAPEFEVRWSPGGAVFPSHAIAAVPWGDAAAVVDANRRLHRFHRDGRMEPIADQVSNVLASQDAQLLGYASGGDYGPKDVHVVDANGRDRVVAGNVLAPALLSFDRGANLLHLLAAGPGGVAGEHVIDLAAATPSARCLTNCALVTGEDWGDAFVEPPGQVTP